MTAELSEVRKQKKNKYIIYIQIAWGFERICFGRLSAPSCTVHLIDLLSNLRLLGLMYVKRVNNCITWEGWVCAHNEFWMRAWPWYVATDKTFFRLFRLIRDLNLERSKWLRDRDITRERPTIRIIFLFFSRCSRDIALDWLLSLIFSWLWTKDRPLYLNLCIAAYCHQGKYPSEAVFRTYNLHLRGYMRKNFLEKYKFRLETFRELEIVWWELKISSDIFKNCFFRIRRMNFRFSTIFNNSLCEEL